MVLTTESEREGAEICDKCERTEEGRGLRVRYIARLISPVSGNKAGYAALV